LTGSLIYKKNEHIMYRKSISSWCLDCRNFFDLSFMYIIKRF